ncbi:MAG: DUF2142 domain-containing protein [Oscillospiraceae bacterium]|nr:DUF2142 domain-containing protein [Oscillospiraceae bacterium]
MKKLKDFLNKYRHPLWMTVILVGCICAFGFTALISLQDAASKSERTIINDDYSVITDRIDDNTGVKQNIYVKGGTKLYGVNMNFHIYDRVQRGFVFVDLYDKAGNLLATSSRDMTTILDNTFKGFIFDKMIYSIQDSEYIIHVHASPRTEEDGFALWKSENTYTGFELTENDADVPGTIALQYITRHTGDSVYGFFAVIAAIATAGLELAYYMLFVRKAKLHNVFAVISLTVGMVFCLFTPVNGGPDEYVHFATSYMLSNELLGIENLYNDNQVLVRECDSYIPLDRPVDYDAFSFRDMYNGLKTGTEGKTELVAVNARFVRVHKQLYMAQTLGITLARLLGMGFVPLVLMGRFFNLLMYTALVWLAVKIMPIFKTTLALCALLPMSMQIAGNFSYDTYILAMALLFTASVFNLAYGKKKIRLKDLILPAVTMCLLAPAKRLYMLMGLLIFTVPDRLFADKKKAWLSKCGIFAMALACWLSVNSGAVSGLFNETVVEIPVTDQVQTETVYVEETSETPLKEYFEEKTEVAVYPFQQEETTGETVFYDPDSDIQVNGDSKYYYNIPYILTHLRQTVTLVANTIATQTGTILQCIIGTRLGEIIVVDLQASWIWFIAILMVLLLSVTQVKKEKVDYPLLAKLTGAVIFIGILALTVVICITWTPINYTTIFGIQGRYVLPALPLMVMFFHNKFITMEKNIDRILLYSILPLDILVVLNVFMLMAAM